MADAAAAGLTGAVVDCDAVAVVVVGDGRVVAAAVAVAVPDVVVLRKLLLTLPDSAAGRCWCGWGCRIPRAFVDAGCNAGDCSDVAGCCDG